MNWSFQARVNASFVVAALLMGSVELLSYWSITQLFEAAERRKIHLSRGEKLESIFSYVKDAQRGERGYIITGDEDYLAPHSAALAKLDSEINGLESLNWETPAQRLQWNELKPLIGKALARWEKVIAARRERGEEAAKAMVREGDGKAFMDEIGRIISAMISEGEREFLAEDRAVRAAVNWATVVSAAGGALAVAIVLLSASMVRREFDWRQRAEEEVRLTKEELDRFFTLSLDLTCVADFAGRFRRVNPAWERTLGFASDELVSRAYLELVHPEDREATAAEAQRLSGGGETVAFENRYRTNTGSYRWLSWKASSVPAVGMIYATARDITEQKLAEEKLRQQARELEAANKELEAFTYSVSHDLRAPLRHVDGFSKILMEEYAGSLDAEGRRYLERVRQGTQQMGRLIDDLLNLARVFRMEVRKQVTGLRSLVEESREELEPETQDRSIEWRVGALPFVECDPALMKQVFANLLSNAVKFTRPRNPAVIEVGQRLENGSPVVFVRDNGVGFSMKYADKLFGVFQRLHRQEDFDGTGVGLATVNRIIQMHGGRLWAEAELDKGATFYFTLAGPARAKSCESTTTMEGEP